MRVEISTLGRIVCTLLAALMLTAGLGEAAFAQRHPHKDNNRGRHLGWTRGRHLGWERRADDRHRRRAFNRRLRDERRSLLWRDRVRGDRVGFRSRDLNRQRSLERRALRQRQRDERRLFRSNWRDRN